MYILYVKGKSYVAFIYIGNTCMYHDLLNLPELHR